MSHACQLYAAVSGVSVAACSILFMKRIEADWLIVAAGKAAGVAFWPMMIVGCRG